MGRKDKVMPATAHSTVACARLVYVDAGLLGEHAKWIDLVVRDPGLLTAVEKFRVAG